MSAIDAIRKFKWLLIGTEVFTASVMLVGLLAVQEHAKNGSALVVVYGAGFVATIVWFPICYLLWFSRPNLPALTTFHKVVFWFAACLFAVFWLRVFAYALAR